MPWANINGSQFVNTMELNGWTLRVFLPPSCHPRTVILDDFEFSYFNFNWQESQKNQGFPLHRLTFPDREKQHPIVLLSASCGLWVRFPLGTHVFAVMIVKIIAAFLYFRNHFWWQIANWSHHFLMILPPKMINCGQTISLSKMMKWKIVKK